MKRVLVIGANSYIGQKLNMYCQNELKEKIHITLVSASDGSWKNIDFTGFESVIHLSGLVHKKEKKGMEELYYNINYKLSVEIAKKSKESNVKQFVFMSSAAIFDPNEKCISSNTKPNPRTLYGKSKLAAEKAIRNLESESFCVTIIRPPMVYGEKCKGNYTKLQLLAKYLPVFPEIHNKRSMIHIDHLCDFIVELILNEKSGCFHPQDANYVDTFEMFIKFRCEMGKKTFILKNTDKVIRALIPYNNTLNKMFNDFYYENV